jgi:hypothetical protein
MVVPYPYAGLRVGTWDECRVPCGRLLAKNLAEPVRRRGELLGIRRIGNARDQTCVTYAPPCLRSALQERLRPVLQTAELYGIGYKAPYSETWTKEQFTKNKCADVRRHEGAKK